jgi:carboxypeptidase family protein
MGKRQPDRSPPARPRSAPSGSSILTAARLLGLVVCFALLTFLVATRPVAAGGTVTLSGVVRGPTGSGAAGVNVSVYQGGSGSACCTWITATSTDAAGAYAIALAAGTYRVQFYPTDASGLVGRWYTTSGTARIFDQASDIALLASLSLADVQLEAGAAVAGQVTDAGTGAGIANVNVSAYAGGSSATCCTWVTGTASGSDGTYRIRLPAGTTSSYRLQFYASSTSGYMPTWWTATGGASDFGAASDLLVNSDISGKNGSLASGRRVTGQITSASDGTPIVGASASAFVGGTSSTCCTWKSTGRTDSNGQFSFIVPSGTYRIGFDGPGGAGFIPRWWKGGSSSGKEFETASDVDLTAGGTSLNAVLPQGLHATGTVSDGSGSPIQGVGMSAYEGGSATCCTWVASATTDANGAYDVVIPSGTYRFRFTAPASIAFISMWWDGASGAAHFDGATDVVVNAAISQNVTLSTGARVVGTITSDGTTPVAGAFVSAFVGGNADCCSWAAGTAADDHGNYSLDLPTGTYRLNFSGPRSSDVLPRWYDGGSGVRDFDNAVDVVVAVGAADTSVNMTLINGTVISGTVLDGSGNPIASVGVGAFLGGDDARCCKWSAGTATLGDGSFAVVVPDGTYRVQFFPPGGSGFIERWWTSDGSGASRFGQAEDVIVAGSDASVGNVTLSSGHELTGKVTDGAGHGVVNAGVGAFSGGPGAACCTWVGGGATNADGNYSFVLAEGTYRLQLSPLRGSARSQRWWTASGGASDFGSADDVDVLQDTTVADIALAAGVHIKGRVTSDGTTGLADISINAFKGGPASCCTWLAGVLTDKSGAYDLLVPGGGAYRLQFSPSPGTAYLGRWWKSGVANGVDRFDLAGDVPLSTNLGAVTLLTGIAVSGTVTGTVTNGIAPPLSGAVVSAFAANTSSLQLSGSLSQIATRVTVTTSPNPQPTGGGALQIGSEVITFASYNAATKTFDIGGGGRGAFGTTPAAHASNAAVSVTSLLWVAGSATDHTGRYQLSLPSGGSYELRFMPPRGSIYQPTWWDGSPQGTSNYVAAASISAAATLAAVQMPHGPALTGVVTDPTGAVVHGAVVSAQTCTDDVPPVCTPIASATTDGSGAYSIVLPAGTYKLFFSGPPNSAYLGQWLTSATTHLPVFEAGDSPPVPVVRNATVLQAQNMTLFDAASGTVTDATSDPVVSAKVEVLDCSRTACTTAASTLTDATGAYRLFVRDGTYALRFTARSNADNPATVADNATDFVTLLCAGMTLNAPISQSLAAPFALVVNEAVPSALWTATGWIAVDSELMHYSALNAATKTFTVDARGTTAAHTANATVRRGTSGAAEGCALATLSGGNATGRDGHLTQGAQFNGVVQDWNGSSLASVDVSAVTCPTDQSQPCSLITNASTDNNGNYDFAVPTGTFKIRILDALATGSVAARFPTPEYLQDLASGVTTSTRSQAADVASSLGGVTVQVPVIIGSVQDFTGDPLANVQVAALACTPDSHNDLIDPNTFYCTAVASVPTASVVTGNDGTFRLFLPVGTYEVKVADTQSTAFFSRPEYVDYDTGLTTPLSLSAAKPFVVSSDTVSNGMVTALTQQDWEVPVISGTLMDSTGNNFLSAVQVVALACVPAPSAGSNCTAVASTPTASAVTDDSGNFSLLLPLGTYELQVTDTQSPARFPSPEYVDQPSGYTTAASPSAAAPFVVSSDTVGGLTAYGVQVPVISGTVQDSNGNALANVEVAVLTCTTADPQSCSVAAKAVTSATQDGNGNTFDLLLPSGTYEIRLRDLAAQPRFATARYVQDSYLTTGISIPQPPPVEVQQGLFSVTLAVTLP